MAGDASQHGIGAVILHITSDGSEKQFAYASRTIYSSELTLRSRRRLSLSYIRSQEILPTYFQLSFHTCKHKPLTVILEPKSNIPQLAAAWMRHTHWALLLSGHSYIIQFWPTYAYSNDNRLSQLPLLCCFTLGNYDNAAMFNIE